MRWEGWVGVAKPLFTSCCFGFWLLICPDQWRLSYSTLEDLSAQLLGFLCFCTRICTDRRCYRNTTLSRIPVQFERQITRDLFSLTLHISQICPKPIVGILFGTVFGFVLVAGAEGDLYRAALCLQSQFYLNAISIWLPLPTLHNCTVRRSVENAMIWVWSWCDFHLRFNLLRVHYSPPLYCVHCTCLILRQFPVSLL